MVDEQIRQAVEYFKQGNKDKARELLTEAVRQDPHHQEAWFGLALCSETEGQKRHCLEKVLEINPNHQKALQALEKLSPVSNALPSGEPGMPLEKLSSQKSVQKSRFSPSSLVSPILLAVFAIAILWLWIKVDRLQKQLAVTETSLANVSAGLTALETTINYMAADLVAVETDLVNIAGDLAIVKTNLAYATALAKNADFYAHSHPTYSDSRLKTEFDDIPNALNRVLALQAVLYRWNADAQAKFGLGDQVEVGLIAQEVEQQFPELVSTDENGYKHVDYARLSAVLVEAIKAQQTIIDDLSARIAALEENK